MTEFARRLSEEMDYLGIKKADLSRELNIPDSTIRSWWSRDAMPAADVALKVAQFLNVSLEYLITGKNAPPKKEKRQEIDSVFLESFSMLSESDKEEIKDIINLKLVRKQKIPILQKGG